MQHRESGNGEVARCGRSDRLHQEEFLQRRPRAAKIIGGLPRVTPGDLLFLTRLIEAGELRTVIDRRYPLQEIADAFRYAEAGHKKGHVVINIAPNPG